MKTNKLLVTGSKKLQKYNKLMRSLIIMKIILPHVKLKESSCKIKRILM